MTTFVLPLAFWLLPVAAVVTTLRGTPAGRDAQLQRPNRATILLWLVVAVPSTIQFAEPRLLDWLERDWTKIGDGQVWRLITSIVVQDGGLVGTVFNLFVLAIVATAAQSWWTPGRIWLTFWICGIGANLLVAHWEPRGGGNSMATFALACALALNAALASRSRAQWPAAAATALCVVGLAAARDYHAAACALGLLAGAVPPYRQTRVRTAIKG